MPTGFVNNGGYVNVEGGGAVTSSNALGIYNQSAGTTNVDGGWYQQLTYLQGGQLTGSGTVGGTVYNSTNTANTGANAGIFGNVSGGGSNLTFTGLVSGAGNYGGVVSFEGA